MPDEVTSTLQRVAAGLPGGGESRPGQVEMATAVAASMAGGRNLVVQAGTGTGKSLAYLVPAALSGERVVVATATKALQDQLADQVRSLVRWAGDTTSGDRAELPFEPHFRAWAMVSTTARECPGAFRCPSGRDCFAEHARARAAEADVIVVNTHLYGAHLASGGAVLPEHQVVVFDEAHEVEDVMTDSLGLEVGPGRFRALATAARSVLDSGDDGSGRAVEAVADLADVLHRVLRPWSGRRVPQRDLADGSGVGSGSDDPAGDRAEAPAPVDEPVGLDLGLAPLATRPAKAPRTAAAGTSTATAVGSDPDLGTLLALASG